MRHWCCLAYTSDKNFQVLSQIRNHCIPPQGNRSIVRFIFGNFRQYCQENINWKRREEVFAETCIMRLLSAVWKFYTCFPAVRNPCCWWGFFLACRFWSYHNFDQNFWFQTFFAFKAGIFGWCQWTNRILTKLFGFRTSFDFSADVDAGHLLSQTMITTSR